MMMGPVGMGPPQMAMPGMPGPPAQPPKPLFPSAVVVCKFFKSDVLKLFLFHNH